MFPKVQRCSAECQEPKLEIHDARARFLLESGPPKGLGQKVTQRYEVQDDALWKRLCMEVQS